MHRAIVRGLAFTLLALLLAAPSRAQSPATPPPPPAASAPRDTARSRPPRLHPWVEFGGGGMSSPSRMTRLYQSSQGFGAGLETRPRACWALRAALDYQMLVAESQQQLYIVRFVDSMVVDTVHNEIRTTGWIAGARAETGVRLPGDFWLTAGAGGGYMHSGMSGVETDANTGYPVLGYGDVANGWGWLWTAAVRYDFNPAPALALGLDARTTSLERAHDRARLWLVRICFRFPDPAPRGSPPRRR